MKDVVALTYNVDYWDYRGWRDTLAAPEYSKRQYKYAKARGDMDVYTPQMIIDGASHVVGSQKPAVIAAINHSLTNPPPMWIPVSIFANDAEFQITVDQAATRRAGPGSQPVVRFGRAAVAGGDREGRECRSEDRLYECRAQARAGRHVAWRTHDLYAAQGQRDDGRQHELRRFAADEAFGPRIGLCRLGSPELIGHTLRKRPDAFWTSRRAADGARNSYCNDYINVRYLRSAGMTAPTPGEGQCLTRPFSSPSMRSTVSMP